MESIPAGGMPTTQGAPTGAGELNWDPEGLMPTREEGLIDRRMRERAAKQDEKYVETMKEQAAKLAKQDKKRRESRTPPTTSFGMIDFLLETPAEDV